MSRDIREVGGRLEDGYDLRDAYEEAHAKRDPFLSPHGLFRSLARENSGHASEFLQKFGPLTLEAGTRMYGSGATIVVNLAQFWGLHLRFSLVSELWEALHQKDRLARALLEIYNRRNEISEWGQFPLGTQFSLPPSNRQPQYEFPWQLEQQSVDTWLRRASADEMRECALALIHLELNVHMRGRQIVWQRGWEPSKEKFRPVIWVDSLWSAIWEFFGNDIAGVEWRMCPHCQKLFYPRRKDQLYCNPKQQALASKRNYAARRRAEERRQKNRGNRKS